MNGLVHQTRLFLSRNASTILTGLGGAGVVVTSVLAVKATPKAMALLQEASIEKEEPLTKIEIAKVTAPAYIPAVIVGVSTIACIFGANILSKRSQAALTSAYALLDSSYKDYKKKVIEMHGEEFDQAVRQEVAKDKYTGDEKSEDNDKQLFYEEYSGRYFESTMADVLKAQYELNRIIAQDSGVFLNEYFELLGLEPTDYGNYLGWSSFALVEMYWDCWIEFNNSKFTFDDGLECTILTIVREPIFDPENY